MRVVANIVRAIIFIRYDCSLVIISINVMTLSFVNKILF